jgi:DNA-binding MarR family transcriptional regulator
VIWIVQVSIPPPWAQLTLDMNADGGFSVSDLGPMLVHVFFLPGDSLLWLAFGYAPGIAEFLNLSHSAFGGVESALLSTLGWLIGILALGTVYSMLNRFVWAVRAYLSGLYTELMRRTRVGRILMAYRVRSWREARAESELSEFTTEVELDDTDMKVLNLHSRLGSDTALGLREIAQRIGVSVPEAQGTVDKLKRLELLANRMDEKRSYRLTQPGQMFLVSRNMVATG